VKVFKDNKSSFVAGCRDEFTEMLEEIRKRNVLGDGERIDGVFVYMASRLARNFEE
jgi:DNA invertase Pin-like site-specific DNA recombinase